METTLPFPFFERDASTDSVRMLRALIVEDNAEFSAFLKSLLKLRYPSATVLQAADASQALQHLRQCDLDVVLMDINLPGEVNGLALTEAIRHDGALPPVVILTNHDLPEYRQAAARIGADRFLSKGSTTAEQILAAVEEVAGASASDDTTGYRRDAKPSPDPSN